MQFTMKRSKRPRPRPTATGFAGADDDDEPAAAPSRGSVRGAGKKRKSYAESDDSAHDSD